MLIIVVGSQHPISVASETRSRSSVKSKGSILEKIFVSVVTDTGCWLPTTMMSLLLHPCCMHCLFEFMNKRYMLTSPKEQNQMSLHEAMRPAVMLDCFF